jgi:hypothetical protein
MKTKPRQAAKVQSIQPAFWDASAITPLCTTQPQSKQARQAARIYSRRAVWWLTSVEVTSALSRLVREGNLKAKDSQQAFDALNLLRRRWDEIQPTEEVRHSAEKLLGSYKLRAADAVQLAAALVWCSGFPKGRYFICADKNLSEAAENEGFTVVHLN